MEHAAFGRVVSMSMEPHDAQWMTVTDVGRRLDLSGDGVRYLERKGLLQAIRTVGGIRLFCSDEVERVARERNRGHGVSR